jgi:hypothetical protein
MSREQRRPEGLAMVASVWLQLYSPPSGLLSPHWCCDVHDERFPVGDLSLFEWAAGRDLHHQMKRLCSQSHRVRAVISGDLTQAKRSAGAADSRDRRSKTTRLLALSPSAG